ncbi:unnamed protein product [Spirodela intermedia]|uniref:General transcription and DNA repair factor IIH subunit TFB5 n=1 Tax=Spirodela intermedia TaxID=51605 RepID=A0A7I8IZZ9_SPIIN|nr:unnamed protein product [Spirodela intermedia]CAA6663379.1 unnamed protein product [Spirodela intermedia]
MLGVSIYVNKLPRLLLSPMVNAIKGLFITWSKFILQILDDTHLFVQPHAGEMIKSRMSEFREQNTYEKPT